MKNVIAFLTMALITMTTGTAHAQMGQSRVIAPGKQVVTSLQKCFDQLDEADVAEIRNNYVKPWQECQKRLAIKKRKEQTAKAGDDMGEASPKEAENPRNYVRVQKTPYGKKSTDDEKATDTTNEKTDSDKNSENP